METQTITFLLNNSLKQHTHGSSLVTQHCLVYSFHTTQWKSDLLKNFGVEKSFLRCECS